MGLYVGGNVVTGTRAEDEWKVDWKHVKFQFGAGKKQPGLTKHMQASKNNREQRDRETALQCTSACKGERALVR